MNKNKSKLWLALLLPVALLLIAYMPSEDAQMYLLTFTGIMTDKPVAQGMVGREVINADIILRGGKPMLKQRAGFSAIGGTDLDKASPIAGIFEYIPIVGEERLIVASGTQLLVYNTELDSFLPITYDPTASTCTLEAGNDTVKAVDETFWWELSHRAFTHLTVVDAESLYVKAWLNDRIAVLDTTFDSTDYTGVYPFSIGGAKFVVSCTTSGTGAGIIPGHDNVFESELSLKRGLNFMDTLIIAGPHKRITWAPIAEATIATSPELTAIDDWPNFRRKGAFATFEGPLVPNIQAYDGMWDTDPTPDTFWAGGDWVQIEMPMKSGAARYINKAFQVKERTWSGGPVVYQFYMDSLDYAYLSSNTDSTWKFKRLGSPRTNEASFTLLLAGVIANCVVDSHIDQTLGYRTVVDSITGVFVQGWPVDTADSKTWVSGWNGRTKDRSWVHTHAVALFHEGDSTRMSIFGRQRVAGGSYPHDDVLRTGDSIFIWELEKGTATIPVDSVQHETWYYPIQIQQNNRLYYSGANDDPNLLWWLEEFVLDSTANFGALYVDRDDGDRITAVVPYNKDIVLFKNRSVYHCRISPYDNEIDEVVKLKAPSGVPAQEAVATYLDKVYFVSVPRGIFVLAGMEIMDISAPVHAYVRDSISGNVLTVVYEDPNIGTPGLYIAYVNAVDAGVNDTYWNNRILRYDLVTQQWTKYVGMDVSCFSDPFASKTYKDTLLWGSTNDYILDDYTLYVMKFPGGLSDTGQSITMSYLSTFGELGNMMGNKLLFNYMPLFKSTNVSNSWTTTWYTDWSGTATETDVFTPDNGWQAPRRKIDSTAGQSVAIKLSSSGVDTVIIPAVEIYFREQGSK